MKVLIAGANGQLGREMTELCRKRGMEVLAADSKMLDIVDFAAVKKTFADFRPDWVINCAAYNAVDLAEKEWKQAFMVNGYGPKHLALAAAEHDAVLVHYSTDYVFDGKKANPYTVADVPCPLSRYGTSKLLGEQMVRHHCTRHYIIRTSLGFRKGEGELRGEDPLLEPGQARDPGRRRPDIHPHAHRGPGRCNARTPGDRALRAPPPDKFGLLLPVCMGEEDPGAGRVERNPSSGEDRRFSHPRRTAVVLGPGQFRDGRTPHETNAGLG